MRFIRLTQDAASTINRPSVTDSICPSSKEPPKSVLGFTLRALPATPQGTGPEQTRPLRPPGLAGGGQLSETDAWGWDPENLSTQVLAGPLSTGNLKRKLQRRQANRNHHEEPVQRHVL